MFLANVNSFQLASTLDDNDPAQMRRQLVLILDLDRNGVPRSLDLQPVRERAYSFVRNVATSAAAMAGHKLRPNDTTGLQRSAQALETRIRRDISTSIRTAIDAAIASTGDPLRRAQHLKRTIGLSSKQRAALDTMESVLSSYVEAPRNFVAANVRNGVREPARYERRFDATKALNATRGTLSAAQRNVLRKAFVTPSLNDRDAAKVLDRHAKALLRHRIKTGIGFGLHRIAETTKLTAWRIAQRLGFLSPETRRFWHTAGDERVRHTHRAVPGMNPNGVGLSEPFKTPIGPAMHPPLEINCRCRVRLRKVSA